MHGAYKSLVNFGLINEKKSYVQTLIFVPESINTELYLRGTKAEKEKLEMAQEHNFYVANTFFLNLRTCKAFCCRQQNKARQLNDSELTETQ